MAKENGTNLGRPYAIVEYPDGSMHLVPCTFQPGEATIKFGQDQTTINLGVEVVATQEQPEGSQTLYVLTPDVRTAPNSGAWRIR